MNYTTKYQDYPLAEREYKSTVFCMAFNNKEDLLSLYNAVNGTNHNNADDLEINTIENAIYLSMKNDKSFLFDCTMNLYEHQSSYNPNMPIRGILYFSRLYEKYITKWDINIYSSVLQKLPTPRYIVFYNGTQKEPDKKVLRLSDAFEVTDGCLECEVTMYNINYGRNRELMEKCRRLEEYAIFIATTRKYLKVENNNMNAAINIAIDECIEKNILKDILIAHRAEVLSVLLTTFNKELYERGLKEDAYSAGVRVGEIKGKREGILEGRNDKLNEQINKKLTKGKSVEMIADELEESVETIRKIIEEFSKK